MSAESATPSGLDAWPHPNDMTREQLREVVFAMGWMALDLAQHLNFANLQFQEGGCKGPEDDDAESYIAAERMAYAISHYCFDGPAAVERQALRTTPGIAIFDGKGGFS